jgi:hypothetical protein
MSKERLVELIADARADYYDYSDEMHESGMSVDQSSEEYIADYLIANGVVVPPCKVGSKVYWQNMGGKITEATVIKLLQARVDNGFEYDIPFEEIGKTIFLSREEAEKALEDKKYER